MRIDRRLRNSLRGRRMLRPFGVFGMHGIWLRLPVGLRWRGLPHGRLPISRRGSCRRSFLAANAKGCKPLKQRAALGFGMSFGRHFSPMRADLVLRRKRQIIDLRHPLRPDNGRIGCRGNEWARLVMLA